jgi:hypothetical protein
MSAWFLAIAFAGVLLAGAVAAFLLDQPSHVVRTLTILGAVFGVSFGATMPTLRHSYQQAELRKVVAADL